MRDSNRLKEKYEVSLDNRQVATLAVASLVVLGGVFLLGVVVGKKLSGEVGEKAPADLLGQLDRKAAELESIKQQDASLTFQDELTRKAPAPSPAPAHVAEVVKPPPERPAEKKEPERHEAAPAPSAVARAESSPAVAAGSPDPAAPPVKLAESPRSEAVPTRTHDGGGLKEAFGKAQRSPTEAAPDGSWTVQLAAYQERADAERFAAGLRDKGYAPYIAEVSLSGRGVWFRVRMGRFPSKEAASRYLEDFRRETSMNAIVTGAN
jgi:DedD protein